MTLFLEELQLIDQQISQLDPELANLLNRYQAAVELLAEVPGLGVDSAQQIIAEVGVKAATFPSAKQLSSWVGACPGEDESGGVSKSHRSPKGNRQMRRILNQAANAAAESKGTIFEIVYRRLVSRLGHNQTIGAIAHRLCRLIWIILHQGVRYEERGPSVNPKSRQRRTHRMIRELRSLGYRVMKFRAARTRQGLSTSPSRSRHAAPRRAMLPDGRRRSCRRGRPRPELAWCWRRRR